MVEEKDKQLLRETIGICRSSGVFAARKTPLQIRQSGWGVVFGEAETASDDESWAMDHEVHPRAGACGPVDPMHGCWKFPARDRPFCRLSLCLTSPLFKSDCDIRRAFHLCTRL